MPRPKLLEKLNIGEIQRLLDQKLSHLQDLQEQRRQLKAQLREVDREIRRLRGARRGRVGVPVRGRRRRRSESQRPLREFVREVLAQHRKGLRPKEIFEAVREAGYRSQSQRPYLLIHQALSHLMDKGEVMRDAETHTYRLAKE